MENEAKTGLEIVLAAGGARLAGIVLDATGGPIAGAIVKGMSPSATSAAIVQSGDDGRFVLRVDPGMTDVTAEAFGYAAATASHVAPSDDLVLTLIPGSSIQGVVVAEGTGAPVDGVDVHTALERRLDVRSQHRAASSSDGSFAILGLEPGAYRLVAEAPGWRGQSSDLIRIGVAQTVNQVRVTVSPVAGVTGKVVLASSGDACPHGLVKLGPGGTVSPYDLPEDVATPASSGVPSLAATLERGGDVHFAAVPPGAYRVVVQCAGHVLSDGPTTLTVGHSDVTGVVWKVRAGLGLIVHVVDDAGHPMPVRRTIGPPIRRVMGPGKRCEQPELRVP
jgi:hypothetical protein